MANNNSNNIKTWISIASTVQEEYLYNVVKLTKEYNDKIKVIMASIEKELEDIE